MLTPPAMSTGREALTKAITAAISEGYELTYPQAGSFRTGIISVDLTGDGVKEAVCFYRTGGKLGFLVMREENAGWAPLTRGESEAASVGRVEFGDLDADGTQEMIVGWQYLTETNGTYEVYSVLRDNAVSLFNGLYSRFAVCPGERGDRLVVLTRNSVSKSATASLIGYQDGTVRLINTVAMYGQTVSYLNVLAGTVSSGFPAVYVDGQMENGQINTEVLAINEQGRLTNELLTALNTDTWRYTAVYCRDVNGDGVPEVPVEKKLPVYHRNGEEENLFLIEWNGYDGKKMTPVSYAFVDMTERFSLDFPTAWRGKITVERPGDSDRSFTFKTMEGKELFTIRIFSTTEYEEESKAAWRQLAADSDRVYTVRCVEGNEYKQDYQSVYNAFSVIN